MPQELQPVGDRHPHVEDDGVRADAVGELETGLGDERGGDVETLELEHPRERIGDRSVVVHDQDGSWWRTRRGALGRGNHRIILKAKEIARQAPGWRLPR